MDVSCLHLVYRLTRLRLVKSWEFHVTESDRNLWRVQSMAAPLVGSEAMKGWVEAGKAVPWEGMHGMEKL